MQAEAVQNFGRLATVGGLKFSAQAHISKHIAFKVTESD